jgi:L-serine dehydratase
MENHQPSIFNDVIGPVMRGPSSSHSAAALRIGRICRDLMGGDPGMVVVRYDRNDALATTHESQGSDMGMKGGLMGFDPDDLRLLNPDEHLKASGIDIAFEITDTGNSLSNLYLVQLKNQKEEIQVIAISTGGGMVELIEINGNPVSIKGDYYEVLIYSEDQHFLQALKDTENWVEKAILHDKSESFIQLKANRPPDAAWIREMKENSSVRFIHSVSPVLPVLSRNNIQAPFSTYEQMMQYNEKKQLSAWELAIHYETIRGNITREEVLNRMGRLHEVMRNAVVTGLKGTSYKDRIFGAQSGSYLKSMQDGRLSGGESLHNITMYVSATMEVKSSMGTIVAAPTAGSCGTFPGAVLGVADAHGLNKKEIERSLLAGSLVGLFIASGSTFSAEIGGCQAECGSAAGMAAASIVYLLGGDLQQSMSAASMALQNSLGMICDPIAARVEAPCLGKNISSAVNALACANLAIAGYDHLIPLDEVIATMDVVGRSLPKELRCTALGGLSKTPAAKKLEKKLRK